MYFIHIINIKLEKKQKKQKKTTTTGDDLFCATLYLSYML